MSKTYVISDLHGRFDLLQKAIAAIEEQAPHSGKHTIITTGDYIDRGLESAQVLTYLMNYKSDRFTMINLRGNHDEMLVDASQGHGGRFWCTHNGGDATMFSYGQKVDQLFDWGLIPDHHVAWVKSLPYYYEDAHRVYVHAGIKDPQLPLDAQSKDRMVWMRYTDYPQEMDFHYKGKHIVHGHESYEDGPKFWVGRTCLDTCAFWTGRLVVGVFDDDKQGSYTSSITIQGPTYTELARSRQGAL